MGIIVYKLKFNKQRQIYDILTQYAQQNYVYKKSARYQPLCFPHRSKLVATCETGV